MKQISAMIEALRSDGPHPQLAPKLRLFGQFVGRWDVEITNYKPDGSCEDGRYGVFHIFSLVSIGAVTAGVIPLLRKKRGWYKRYF